MFPQRIVAIGASSCEGSVDPQGSGFIGRLRKWHQSHNQHYHTYNLGISGDTTPGMLKRLVPEATPREPDFIIIQLGPNDASREDAPDNPPRTDPDTYQANVKKLISQAKSLADHVLFISNYPIDEARTTPVSWRELYYFNQDVKRYNQIALQVAKEADIPTLDLFNTFQDEDYDDYLHTDGLHANPAGHQKIFELLRTKLTNRFGQPKSDS